MKHTPSVSPLIGIGVCVLLLCTASVRCATALPSGLVAWWPGDSNANDFSGNENHATLVNGAQVGVPGLMGGAFQFDGVAAFVSTLLLLPSQGTIDLWVKPSAISAAHGILGTFGTADGDNRLWITATGADGGPGVGANRVAVNLGSRFVNDLDVPSPFIIGTWTHLALTFDYVTSHYTLYVNGQVAATSTATRIVPSHPVDFGGEMSFFAQNFYWNGLIDEVHVFDRVLTPSEIQELATPVENGSLVSLAPASLWIGLKNSDDQGTRFDLRTEVYLNTTLVSAGITRCIAGVTRNPTKATEVAVPFGPITDEAFEPGATLSLTVSTRIGTNPDDSKCPGHNNAVGLRLYYDAMSRPSRFGAEIAPDPRTDFFLHDDAGLDEVLDNRAPTATAATFHDSSKLNFSRDNPWHEIGTWSMTLP